MNVIGVINAQAKTRELVKSLFAPNAAGDYELRFCDDTRAAMDFLSFDMPEIVILDFAGDGKGPDEILHQMAAEPWLMNTFAIIGLYDGGSQGEEDILEKMSGFNLVNLIEYENATSNLKKSVGIIQENRQIILRKDLSDKLVEALDGSFEIDNDPHAVSCYSSLIVICLYNIGYISKKIKASLYVALNELIMNGIEHGNCRITYEEKSAFLEQGRDISDLILEKCADPAVARKRVVLEYAIRPDRSVFKIRDEGPGFDWRHIKNPLEGTGLFKLHGRGIMMTKHFVNELKYNEKGNEVTFIISHAKDALRQTPRGFADEEVLDFRAGDVVFREDEESDFLYYVSSGRYDVYHQGRLVGSISPADVFMGEMSFLLNNRRSATVKAQTGGRLIKISKRAFISVIKQYPHYGIFLSKVLAQKLVKTNEQAAQGPARNP